MVNADKLSAIRAKAEALAGRSLEEQGDLLVEMAAQRACAWCSRTDIPAEMEQAVAVEQAYADNPLRRRDKQLPTTEAAARALFDKLGLEPPANT